MYTVMGNSHHVSFFDFRFENHVISSIRKMAGCFYIKEKPVKGTKVLQKIPKAEALPDIGAWNPGKLCIM